MEKETSGHVANWKTRNMQWKTNNKKEDKSVWKENVEMTRMGMTVLEDKRFKV
jgi:hypothetical protein